MAAPCLKGWTADEKLKLETKICNILSEVALQMTDDHHIKMKTWEQKNYEIFYLNDSLKDFKLQ